MANIYEPTPDDMAEWDKWLNGRPAVVKAVAELFPPWKLFRMKDSKHRCQVQSIQERKDGTTTLTVSVDGRFNRVLFGRLVFGVSPDNLEECELPAPGEDVGDTSAEAGYTEKDVREILIPELKRRHALGECNDPNCGLHGGES